MHHDHCGAVSARLKVPRRRRIAGDILCLRTYAPQDVSDEWFVVAFVRG